MVHVTFKPWFVIGLWWLIVGVSQAEVPKVAIVSPPVHHALVHRIEAGLYASSSDHPSVMWFDPAELEMGTNYIPSSQELPELKLIVVVGPAATRVVIDHKPDIPILSILVYRQDYEKIVKEVLSYPEMRIGGLFLDQPMMRHLALARVMVDEPNRIRQVGMILGPDLAPQLTALQRQSMALGLELKALQVSPSSNPVTALNQILEDAEVLLATPDQDVYTKQTVRGILLTAYRKKVPVIGYSHSYMKLGALASLYVTPKQVASQVVETILEVLEQPELINIPKRDAFYYSIAVNAHVARLLNIQCRSESEIKALIEEQVSAHLLQGSST